MSLYSWRVVEMDLEDAKHKAVLIELVRSLTDDEKRQLLEFIKSLANCDPPSGLQ